MTYKPGFKPALFGICVLVAAAAVAAGQRPVTTGIVVRGVTVPGHGAAGASTGRTCDFSSEETTMAGKMTGASVQCASGATLATALAHLPARFNAYCAAQASRVGGQLISAPVPGNAEHCDLSALSPKDATAKFGGAVRR